MHTTSPALEYPAFEALLAYIRDRDAPAWEFLQAEVVPKIVESKAHGEGFRMWSTGYASGEEAYTLAIVFAEVLGTDAFKERVKIYATDVDEEALTERRHASYLLKRVEHLPPEIVKKYFEHVEQRYTFRADLRRCVIFGGHDLVRDPPISKIDLLASCNTLMYVTPDAQTRILANFHFAPVDLKRRIFRRESTGALERTLGRVQHTVAAEADDDEALRDASFEVSTVAQIIVDANGRLAWANQKARTLFELERHDVGRRLQDLELSYRPVELRSRIDQVHDGRHPIALRYLEWPDAEGEQCFYDVTLTPLLSGGGKAVGEIQGVSITFTDVTRDKLLQEEVEASKRDVETAYEELQSTAEELETTNEELQSTNEELETTNEELQSTNAELETINEELNQRTNEVNSANAFLEAILTSIEGGVVVVDRELRVTAWNHGAEQLWGLRLEEAQGQHLMNLDIGLPTAQLQIPLRQAISDGGVASEIVLEATNRRGKAVRVKIVSSTLHLNGVTHGAILLMEEVAA